MKGCGLALARRHLRLGLGNKLGEVTRRIGQQVGRRVKLDNPTGRHRTPKERKKKEKKKEKRKKKKRIKKKSGEKGAFQHKRN